jgi:hypothetical protein
MIGHTVRNKNITRIDQLISDAPHQSRYTHSISESVENPITTDNIMSISEIKEMMRRKDPGARAAFKSYCEAVKKNFQAVRDSPTYTSGKISPAEIEW